MEFDGKKIEELYDRVLVAVGRVPNSADLGLENTKVKLDEKGFVKVNDQQQTDDPNIYAIGDIAGGILLAHKAHKEARIAVENIHGEDTVFESVIPAVVFTDPGTGVVRLDGGGGEGERRDVRGFQISVVGFRSRVVIRPRGRHDENVD